MFWRERWSVGTNDVYVSATIYKDEGWFYWFFLEWFASALIGFLSRLPSIPTWAVDDDGMPYDSLQDWLWCEKYASFYSWVDGKYVKSHVSVDLNDVPVSWYGGIEEEDEGTLFCDSPGAITAYKEFKKAREKERSARQDRLSAASRVLTEVVSGKIPYPNAD